MFWLSQGISLNLICSQVGFYVFETHVFYFVSEKSRTFVATDIGLG